MYFKNTYFFLFQKIPNLEKAVRGEKSKNFQTARSESDRAIWYGAGLRNRKGLFAAMSVEKILVRASKYVSVQQLVSTQCCHFFGAPCWQEVWIKTPKAEKRL